MPKARKPEKSPEEIRDIILKYLYDKHLKSGTRKGARFKITDLKKGLKQYDLKANQIMHNLDYLNQNKWVVIEKETYEFKRGDSVFPSERISYKISAEGIDHFEGKSRFQKPESKYSGINMTNIGSVVQMGDGNVVNVQFKDLYSALDNLGDALRKSDKVTDQEKLEYQAEIDTIKSQISKAVPDKGIVSKAWEKLKVLATVDGIAGFVLKAQELIRFLASTTT